MAISSGFFSSVDGDRKYSADDLNGYFDGLVSEGVYRNYRGALAVSASGLGMSVSIANGRARIRDKFFVSSTSAQITIGSAHATLDRIDSVNIMLDYNSRSVIFYVSSGTPSANPTPPINHRSGQYYEMTLAQVYVAAGTTTITNSMITDKRDDTSVCGYASLIASIDTGVHINQTQAMVDITTSTNLIEIPPTTGYNPDNGDILMVYYGGLYTFKDVDYTVQLDSVTGNYYIHKASGNYSTSVKVGIIVLKAAID